MTTFLEYNQIIEALPSKDKDNIDYYKYSKFKKTYIHLFKFTNIDLLEKILLKWDKKLNEELYYNWDNDLIDKKERIDYTYLSLKEMTTFVNIGYYAVGELKLEPHIAMIFTFTIFYGFYKFECTGVRLTIKQIYEILPYGYRTIRYKEFEKLICEQAFNMKLTKILFDF